MSETAIVWTMIGTGVGITGILLTVLLTVMTMQARAMHGRFDDQNRRFDDLRQHLDKRMDDQNGAIQGRFDDQNQRIADLGGQTNRLAAEIGELRTQLFGARNERQAATG
jgi:DNA anti-recombination protein RmuC